MRSRRLRSGFTLIEVIAAIAISTVLLAAVYATISLMLRAVRDGKETVASLQIIRGTALRLSTDIRQSLAMLVPTPTVADAIESANNPDYTPPDPAPGQVNYGLQGDSGQVTIYGSKQPRYSRQEEDLPNPPGLYGDLRIITYAVLPEVGLIRQENFNILGQSEETTLSEVLAPEVVGIQFQYFDAVSQSWQSQWDGSVNGPPAAVEVLITVQMPQEPGLTPHQPVTHRFVVAIPTFGSPAQGGGTP